MQSALSFSLLELATFFALAALATGCLWMARRYLVPRYPASAFVAASLAAALFFALSGTFEVQAIALAPAIAMIVTSPRPVSADAWLRGAAALAITLTLIASLAGSLMTTVAATATAGVLCWLCAERSEKQTA